MAGVTIFALINWWVTPESAWLPRARIANFVESHGVADNAPSSSEPSDAVGESIEIEAK